jgi:hypothetical protein
MRRLRDEGQVSRSAPFPCSSEEGENVIAVGFVQFWGGLGLTAWAVANDYLYGYVWWSGLVVAAFALLWSKVLWNHGWRP